MSYKLRDGDLNFSLKSLYILYKTDARVAFVILNRNSNTIVAIVSVRFRDGSYALR